MVKVIDRPDLDYRTGRNHKDYILKNKIVATSMTQIHGQLGCLFRFMDETTLKVYESMNHKGIKTAIKWVEKNKAKLIERSSKWKEKSRPLKWG